jgi:cellulose synthase/poly-beta-1,6-N-acetylglucosamine synthase-like glycosyltransferase
MPYIWNILFLILVLYAGIIFYLLIKLQKPDTRKPAPNQKDMLPLPGVSIVIPFRNEADNLDKLLNSLSRQIYEGKYEIILVNDYSTDDYNMILTSKKWRMPLKIIDSVFSENRHLTSKQQALDSGIKAATFDWIACTDADMVLEPNWLWSLMQPALAGTDLVFGHTILSPNPAAKFFRWFQSFQLELLFAVAYVFNKAGITGSCMGNNMLLSRKAYTEVGGFDAIGYSIVEDRDLLTAFRREHFCIATAEPFSATATTLHTQIPNEYFHQLLRWVYGGFRQHSTLSFFGILLSIQNFFFLLALFKTLPDAVALLTCSNFLLTWIFISVALHAIKSSYTPLLFLPFYPLLLIESFVLTISLIFKRPVNWKGRRIA